MNTTLPPELEALLRQILQYGFATLAAHGYIAGSDTQLYIGLAVSIVTAGWAIWRARKSKQTIAAATAVATEAISSPQSASVENAPRVVQQQIKDMVQNQ